MSEQPPDKSPRRPGLSDKIGSKEQRKLRAHRHGTRSIWFGFAMTGLIGWSVAAPMLMGVALGIWLDKHYPATHSWTLTLLVLGLAVGCWNAWRWVAQEEAEMRREEEHDDA
ncbi:MAG: putative F0F1-ATPase subunit [Planctomycetaceae bacterium]|nr:putative F0F1-ATPase subunit [Planctomycetaceae bacterium]